jgi:hypothetical protein
MPKGECAVGTGNCTKLLIIKGAKRKNILLNLDLAIGMPGTVLYKNT